MADLEDDSGRLGELKLLWESDPTDKVYLQLAEEYRRLGQIQEAIKVLETTLAQRPRDPRGRVVLARCRMDLGAFAEAARTLEEVVKLDPAHPVASKHLLECYLQLRDAEKAAERFNLYRLVNDRDPELDHLEFRLRRLQHGDEDDRKPSAEEVKPAAKEKLPMAGPVDPLPFAPFDLSPPAPRAAARAASHAAQPFASSADPFGDLLAPLPTPPPTFDLFEALTPAPAAKAPSLDDFWSTFAAPSAPEPAAVEGPPAYEPVFEPVFEPVSEIAETSPAEASLNDGPIVPWSIIEPMEAYEPPVDAAQALEATAYEPPAYEPPAPAAFEAPAYEPPADEPPIAPAAFEAPVGEMPAASSADEAPVYAVPAYEPAPEPFAQAPLAEAPLAEAPLAEASLAEEAPAGDDLEATATLGDLYLLQGHTAEAEVIFRRVLDRDPDNATALAGLRRMRALSQDWFATPAPAPQPIAPVAAASGPFAAEDPAFAPQVAEPHAYEAQAHEPQAYEAPVFEPQAFEPLAVAPLPVESQETESLPSGAGDRRSWAGRTLTAADLLAGRSAAPEHPEGLTAKKVLVLKRYLQHLRTSRPSYVQ